MVVEILSTYCESAVGIGIIAPTENVLHLGCLVEGNREAS